ncbi:MAG: UDP-N-acetylmuramate dehydrogenase [Treponema sp.]|jgi:UDP-N-acetylmuramate dehydrogenase|nr:UDP-N-acetylmuramate dehydrogenase [Treponema sp.]
MTVQALFERSKEWNRTQAAFSGIAAFDEPMSRHTTFNIGGPADLYLKPDAACFVPYTTALLRLARAQALPVFILGGGANLLVSDKGIRGVVLDTGSWTGDFAVSKKPEGGSCGDKSCRFLAAAHTKPSCRYWVVQACAAPSLGDSPARPPLGTPVENNTPAAVHVRFRSGTLTDDAVRWAAANGLSGLEDFAGLPGTIGGAVWMNARCYERSVSDILIETTFLDERLKRVTVPADSAAFAYKKSPFQGRNAVILETAVSLHSGDSALIAERTAVRRAERETKGHFHYPSAGSVFKNNRDFGKPAGKIVEELGLRGFQIGGAQIAPWHGNFIINTGGASADDVKQLITIMEEKALQTFGLKLEREIIYAG